MVVEIVIGLPTPAHAVRPVQLPADVAGQQVAGLVPLLHQVETIVDVVHHLPSAAPPGQTPTLRPVGVGTVAAIGIIHAHQAVHRVPGVGGRLPLAGTAVQVSVLVVSKAGHHRRPASRIGHDQQLVGGIVGITHRAGRRRQLQAVVHRVVGVALPLTAGESYIRQAMQRVVSVASCLAIVGGGQHIPRRVVGVTEGIKSDEAIRTGIDQSCHAIGRIVVEAGAHAGLARGRGDLCQAVPVIVGQFVPCAGPC